MNVKHKRRRVPNSVLSVAARTQMACGWCKGFVHETWISGMVRYVHDEPPLTDHEVLPYPISPSGRQWQAS